MSKNKSKKWLGALGRVLLAYALLFSQVAWAGQNQLEKDKPAGPRHGVAAQNPDRLQNASAQADESEGGVADKNHSGNSKHEGIKVHGHWTIEVRNPDGRLVRHVDFENSLDPGYSYSGSAPGSTPVQVHGGADYLAALLTGKAGTPTWAIRLAGPAGISNLFPTDTTDAPCVTGGFAQCEISNPILAKCQPINPQPGLGCNLSVSTLGTPPATPSASGAAPAIGPIQLSGSVAATQNGHVFAAGTVIYDQCGSLTTNCAVGGPSSFSSFTSSTNFPGAPISVSSGQTIAVTVSISFS